MDIILLKDIDKVGEKHEVVTVKPGYARNFLIPQGMAIIANKPNMAKLDALKEKEAAAMAARKAEFEAIAEKLKGEVLQIGAKAGASGKIFGSVTSIQLAQALKDQYELEVIRQKVIMPDEEVRQLGTYQAQLNLHPEVDIKVNFEVVAE